MIDLPSNEDTERTPRWVKVSGIIFIALTLFFAVIHLAGKSLHGHTPRAHGALAPSDLSLSRH
jgi:hypothetical protein